MIASRTMRSEDMPRRKGQPKRDDLAVKIEKRIAQQAKFVADRRGVTIAAYLSDVCRGQVERDFQKELQRMAEEGGGK